MKLFAMTICAAALFLAPAALSVQDASAQMASPTRDDFRRLYGIDLNYDLDELPRGGRAIGRVVDAKKMAILGFENVQAGDSVEITNLGAFKWDLEHLPTGQKKRMQGR